MTPGIVGVGLAGGSVADVIRLTASMQVVNEPRFLRRGLLAFQFQWRFIDALIQARVWGLRRTEAIDPFNRDVDGRPSNDSSKVICDIARTAPALHPDAVLTAADRPAQGQTAGPSDSRLQHVDLLVPRRHARDQYHRVPSKPRLRRLAARLPRQRSPQGVPRTVYARRSGTSDFPDAIQEVFDATGRPAQIIAHCVGSLSVLMSLLSGNIHRGTVHSMILSQACAFIDQPFVNRLKAKLHLAEVLRFFGFHPILTADFDLRSNLAVRLLDRLLYFYPEPGALQERRLPPAAADLWGSQPPRSNSTRHARQ